jgi:ribosome-binding factor A
MAERRPERVGHLVQAELANWLLREATDPRLRAVTVTGVRMSRDLRVARIYVRSLGAEEPAATLRALGRAAHAMRGALGHGLGLRVTPELRFQHDATPDQAARVETLLRASRPRGDAGGEGT